MRHKGTRRMSVRDQKIEKRLEEIHRERIRQSAERAKADLRPDDDDVMEDTFRQAQEGEPQ